MFLWFPRRYGVLNSMASILKRDLLEQGGHSCQIAWNLGITWPFLHRMSHTGESDGVKRGCNELCRAVSSTHGESWKRWCFKLVSNQLRVSVRRISLHLTRSIWTYLKPALASTFCLNLKKRLFFFRLSSIFPFFYFHRSLSSTSALPLIHPAQEGTQWSSVSFSGTMQ